MAVRIVSGVSVATQLVEMIECGYRLGVTPAGEAYAVPKSGPQVVRLLRGGRQSLRAEVANQFYKSTGSAASQSALADAMMVAEGKANLTEPIELHLRVAEHNGYLVLDLGDATGQCVVLTPRGWHLKKTPPVLFRRTALTGALPTPERDGVFTALWKALNVGERYRPLVLAVLVSALMPRMPHPVVLLTGEQGTGKTTATARFASITDPSPAQVRKPPRDLESWTTAAAGSWVVALDNLSTIPDWLSDAMCRGSTGDGDVRRRLYSDGDLHVIAFRRVLVVNGIDVGAVRGDLADRLVHLVLELIPDTSRRGDEEMAAEWRAAHPKVLGALLDLTVQVLDKLPTVKLDRLPRMADFAKVLAALDAIEGTTGLKTYLGLRGELAEDAANNDPVLINLAKMVTAEWEGTSAELLTAITPALAEDGFTWKAPKGWPENARQLTAAMTRNAPTLRQLGWTVTQADREASRDKVVRWTLTPPPPNSEPDGQRSSRNGADDAAHAADETFTQLNGHVNGAASSAASARRHLDDAANHRSERAGAA